MTIYLDELFLINAVVDYLILVSSAKICAEPVKRWRLAVSSVLGGVYGAAAQIPGAEILKNPAIIIATGVIMCVSAFGGARRLTRMTLTFLAISAVFGGFVMAASLLLGQGGYVRVSLKLLAAAFVVCYVIISLIFRRSGRASGETVKICITYGERKAALSALVDTGNSLADPATGRPVIVAGVFAVLELFEAPVRDKLTALEKTGAIAVFEALGEKGERFRLIPYSAVGVSGGVLLAFRPDKVTINGKELEGALIGLSPNNVSDGGAYSALAPAVL